MASKAISNTLWVVMSAVVVVVIALVLLTIFGRNPANSLAEFSKQCEIQAKASCQATGHLPITWSLKVGKDSCESLGTVPVPAGCVP